MKTKKAAANVTGVSAVEISQNSKIGTVSATYVSQSSCSSECVLKNNGCYAESGLTKFSTNRVNKSAASVEELANNEAAAIRGLSGYLPLRLHVVGDCKSDDAASTVAAAAADHRAKHQQPVWSYTHAWRGVSRESWGNVSILASCETSEQVKQARSKGFATAMVVSHHSSPKAHILDGIKVVPCPEQTGRAANCESCKLCWNDAGLKASNVTIAFAIHSVSEAKKQQLFTIIK
jgi:hypothetical protein